MTKITTRTITGKYLHKRRKFFGPPCRRVCVCVCVSVDNWNYIVDIVCKHFGQHASIITGPKFSHKMRRAT